MLSISDPCGSELCCSSLDSFEEFKQQRGLHLLGQKLNIFVQQSRQSHRNLPSLCRSFLLASSQSFRKFSCSSLTIAWFLSRSFQHSKASFSPRVRSNWFARLFSGFLSFSSSLSKISRRGLLTSSAPPSCCKCTFSAATSCAIARKLANRKTCFRQQN